jgi:glycosyltransferase involved in cell wall biosynthesis
MGIATAHRAGAPTVPRVPVVDGLVEVVLPVHNEEATLAASVAELSDYLSRFFPFRWRITVADNASTDGTPVVAAALAREEPRLRVLDLPIKGRGAALRAAWSTSDADVLSYMDVDLSTNLNSFLPLVAPLLSGHSDVAIGTRLRRSASVRRQLKREVLSRGYNGLVRLLFANAFSDAQCGFKALRADAAHRLLPLLEDDGWFFDTELLLHAERAGLRIHEVPVDWIEDLDSRVELLPTIAADLRGLWRVRREFSIGHEA